MARLLRAYLAGPTVFQPDATASGQKLISICRAHGLDGVFPPALGTRFSGRTSETAKQLFHLNIRLLHECDMLVADLSPFRGPHADDGTAFEMGVAYALNKPIFGYSRTLQPLVMRIKGARCPDEAYRDEEGNEVEDFGNSHNLMLTEAVHSISATAEEAILNAARFFSLRPAGSDR